jgi:hypothetical protein
MIENTKSKPKIRTITLTDRAPVRVCEDRWPVIASARRHDGLIESEANHLWHLTVRQHSDGRAVVYGSETPGGGGVHRGYEEARAGELVDSGVDLAVVIRRVGESSRCSEAMIAECIAELPAVDLE